MMPIFVLVVTADVEQQHLGHAGDAGLLVDELSPAIDDADVELLLDLAKPRRQRRAIEIDPGWNRALRLVPQALLAALIARPERPDQDVARDLLKIDTAGQQPLKHRPDAADLLDRFVRDVNDSLHA